MTDEYTVYALSAGLPRAHTHTINGESIRYKVNIDHQTIIMLLNILL